ncbi:MAG: hypothetical protein AAGG07_13090 [Planctomycetota bacterium]
MLADAADVNANGSAIVGSRLDKIGLVAFHWTEEEGIHSLGRHPSWAGGQGSATAIDAGDSFVVGYSRSVAGERPILRGVPDGGVDVTDPTCFGERWLLGCS